MIVRVYDFLSSQKPKFADNLQGVISAVVSYKYTRRAYDVGSFEMTIPKEAEGAEALAPERLIIVGEKRAQARIVETTKRSIDIDALYITDVKSTDKEIIISGYDLKYFFAMRVTLFPKAEQDKGTYGYYVTGGSTWRCVADLIRFNLTTNAQADRKIYGLGDIVMPSAQVDAGLTGIQNDRYMTRLEPLSTAIFNLLNNCKTHYYEVRVVIDDDASLPDGYVPRMESGEDKPVHLIDENCYHISAFSRNESTSAYKNAIYAVAGKDNGEALVQLVKREGDTAQGINRKEVVVDVDVDSVSEIETYALKAAEEYTIADDFEIIPLFDEDETAPELAQKVAIRLDNAVYETIITEKVDEYSGNEHKVTYITGNKKLKVLNVINKSIAGNTQKIIRDKLNMSNLPTVGKFTNTDRNAEIFNDYSGNAASGIYSHAEGFQTQATSRYAHAEGWSTTAVSSASHTEGRETVASGENGHAEGYKSTAGGTCSHAEGGLTKATKHSAHAEGFGTEANGQYSHAGGYYTIINTDSGTVVGRYNKTREGLFVVGNGSGAARSDAMVLDDKGNLWIAGSFDMAGGYAPLTEHIADTDNPHSVTKAQIGLGNADNTSDIDKPVSTAAQTAINDAVSAIEIGGTNLLRDSTGNLKTGWNSSLIVDGGGIGGNNCINVYRENSTASTYFIGYFHDEAELFGKLISDDEYVLGAWFRIKSDIPLDSDNNGIRIYQRDDENAVVATTNIYITRDDPTEIWFYRKIRFKFNALMKKPVFNLFLGQNGHFEVCNIKLERGNKDTAWSPSPDDFQTQINSLEEKIAALETALITVAGGDLP